MPKKNIKISWIYFFYWCMLAYILAALVWWFIELNRQNEEMTGLRIELHEAATGKKAINPADLADRRERKIAQYIGEGVTFFLLIVLAALFFFRAIRRQLKTGEEQQHFMMAITHELKTPIAVANLNLETIIKRHPEPEQQQRLLNITLGELARLNKLCNNLLLSSQIDSKGYRKVIEPFDIVNMIRKSSEEFSIRYSGRKIYIESPDSFFLQGDTFLMEMAVNNLIDNALKYSPKESAVHISINTSEHGCRVRFADEGAGIQEKDRKLIFEKYYRTGNEATRKAKGTGLGLYLVKKVCEAHGGMVELENNHPKGSVFILTLPK